MILVSSARWDDDIFPAWRRAAGNVERPNSDVWSELPNAVNWFRGTIEPSDIDNLYVIGSGDWKEVYGSYKLVDIASDSSSEPDRYDHRKKIQALQSKFSAGEKFEPMILVSYFEQGPFVIIDGNHRAIAYYRLCRLYDMLVFVGLHSNIRDFVWFKLALQ